jgi:hypothetical protein
LFEIVSGFKYLGKAVTNQNFIQEEIRRRLNSGNACYHSVQNLLSLNLLLKNVKIGMYKTVILPVVLYGYETLSLSLREEHRLRMLEELHNEELRDLYSSPSRIRMIKSRMVRWAGHVGRMERRTHVGYWWESQKERYY